MKNSFKGTNFLINIYKPLGMFRPPRQKKTKKNYETQQTNQTSKHAYVSHACANYDVFKVAGVDVTSDNYLDLSKISGVSGKVYFDPNTRPSPSTMPLLRQMTVMPS